MPIYTYECVSCGGIIEAYRKMSAEKDDPGVCCPGCESKAKRVPSVTHSDMVDFHTPIEMNSVAVSHLSDIRKLQRECPDAKISDDPADPLYGVPIARNRAAKKQVLKASGYVEK